MFPPAPITGSEGVPTDALEAGNGSLSANVTETLFPPPPGNQNKTINSQQKQLPSAPLSPNPNPPQSPHHASASRSSNNPFYSSNISGFAITNASNNPFLVDNSSSTQSLSAVGGDALPINLFSNVASSTTTGVPSSISFPPPSSSSLASSLLHNNEYSAKQNTNVQLPVQQQDVNEQNINEVIVVDLLNLSTSDDVQQQSGVSSGSSVQTEKVSSHNQKFDSTNPFSSF